MTDERNSDASPSDYRESTRQALEQARSELTIALAVVAEHPDRKPAGLDVVNGVIDRLQAWCGTLADIRDEWVAAAGEAGDRRQATDDAARRN